MDIEEDLKILQEFTELDRKLRNYKVESDYDNFCERRCVAIDHILAEREEDKKIEQLIAMGVKSLTISKKKYDSLKEETKNLIKLNNVKLNFEEEK